MLPGHAPFLPCRKASQHLTRFLSIAGGPSGGPTQYIPDSKVVLTQPPWSNIQTLSGYKKSSFSPRVLNSNRKRPGKVQERLVSDKTCPVAHCPWEAGRPRPGAQAGAWGSVFLPISNFCYPSCSPTIQTNTQFR